MSDAEENKPAEGAEPITIRVRDQVSLNKREKQAIMEGVNTLVKIAALLHDTQDWTRARPPHSCRVVSTFLVVIVSPASERGKREREREPAIVQLPSPRI